MKNSPPRRSPRSSANSNRLFSVPLIAALIVSWLGSGGPAQAQPVNLLWVPMTNNAPGITVMPSDTGLGGASVNLTMLNAAGTATDLAGANGSGVNGVVNGNSALCLTNGSGTTQPSAGNGDYALDNNDAALGFGTLNNWVITMWVNQLVSQGSSTIGPRYFILQNGAGSGDTGVANSLGVKMQQSGQLYFAINTLNPVPAQAQVSAFPTGKWLFFAFVYDGTNFYQYDGSDSAPCQLVDTAAEPGLSVNLGTSASLIIGNRFSKGRALNGWVEDFRLYTNGPASIGNNSNFVETVRKSIAPKIPLITSMYPDGTALMQATNSFTFTASSASGFNLTNLSLMLNGVNVSSGLVLTTNGSGSTNVSASYSGAGLPQQSVVTAVMGATDALGLAGAATVTFDTFSPTNFIIKADEFDFNSGQFIDNPDYTNAPDPNGYYGLQGVEGIDVHKGQSTGDNEATDYRYDDGTGTDTQTPYAVGELPSPTRFGSNLVANPDHMIGNWSSAEWQNYTKTFPAGQYNVYARVTTSSGSTITFSQVTAGQGTADQTLNPLGTFTYTGTGAFQWVPLTHFGQLAVLNLAGVNTVRATTGGGANADFFMLVPANTNVPAITHVYPDGQYLFEATNKLVFTVSSAAANINTANIQLTLNGSNVSSSLVFSGGPSTWNVSYTGLQLNQTYTTAIQVTDNNSQSASANLIIDTWNPVLQVEAEDFDFDPTLSPVPNGTGYRFIDNPVPTRPGATAANSYEGQVGDTYIDEQGNDLNNGQTPIQNGYAGATTSNYRVNDPTATSPVTDTPRQQFVAANALDYNVGFLGPGFWQQYTRTYPTGTFNLYARMASGANLGTLHSSWSSVLEGQGSTNQITRHLGSFAVPSTGGYSSYFYTPLIDRFGNYAQLTLGGENTFRATQITLNQSDLPQVGAYGININFYMLLAARTDLPRIDNVSPDGSVLFQESSTLSFVASSPTYGLNPTNIHVTLNGSNITSGLVISGGPASYNVSYSGLVPSSSYSAVITVLDNNNQTATTTVTFDTFNPNNFTWEAEDFDFDPNYSPVPGTGNAFIDNPVPTSEAASNSYYAQSGDFGIDYSASFAFTHPGTYTYRPLDFVSAEVTADVPRQKYLTAQLVSTNPYIADYDVNYWTNGGWINYTRTYPSGSFYLYGRLSGGNGAFNMQASQVTSGWGTSSQTTQYLGTFKGTDTSFTTFQYVPLVNTNTGLPVILNLGGTNTFQFTGDGNENANFFMLVPVAASANLTASLSGGSIVLSFLTQPGPGLNYTVQYKNNLTDPSWTTLGTVTGNGSMQSLSDSTAGHSQRFYRLNIHQ